jgi:hypothetical protein
MIGYWAWQLAEADWTTLLSRHHQQDSSSASAALTLLIHFKAFL